MKLMNRSAFDAQDPTKLVPHGDRLLIEEVEVEDAYYVGSKKFIIAREEPKKSMRDPNPNLSTAELTELKRGWILGQVVSIGSGHRMEFDVKVPMDMFSVGDLVYVEANCGRKLEFQGRYYRIVNQIDVLCLVPETEALVGSQAVSVEQVTEVPV